jgi:hypothetical protein
MYKHEGNRVWRCVYSPVSAGARDSLIKRYATGANRSKRGSRARNLNIDWHPHLKRSSNLGRGRFDEVNARRSASL